MQRNRTRELKKWLIGQRQTTLDEKSKASQSLTSSHDAPLIPGHRAASNLFPAPWNILAAQGDLRSLKCCPKPATANDPCQWRPTADPALMFTFTVSSVSSSHGAKPKFREHVFETNIWQPGFSLGATFCLCLFPIETVPEFGD